MSKFGENLKELMNDENSTTVTLNKEIGISKTQLGKYLSGYYEPTLKNAIKTAHNITEKSNQLANEETTISEIQKKIKELQIEVSSELTSAKTSKENISTIETDAASSLKKISDLQIKANEKKSEIDDLYDEIMGYETEENQHEEGLKDELEKSYKEIY